MEKWLEKYFKLLKDKPDIQEIGWRHEMVPLLMEEGLGHPRKNIDFEKERADIRISDDDGIPYLIFETKLKEEDINKGSCKEQAFSYIKGGEAYIILTSKVNWRIYRPDGQEIGSVRFSEEGIDNEGGFSALHYELRRSRLENFQIGESPSGYIKLSSKDQFENLINVLRKSHDMFFHYASSVWPRLCEKYEEFLEKKAEIDADRIRVEHNVTHVAAKKEQLQMLDQALRKLKLKYKVEIEAVGESFPLFRKIQPYSKDVKEKDLLEIYLKEACYFALNRALMIRILEDKELLVPKISQNGVKTWRDFNRYIKNEYQSLLRFSFWDAEKIYSHFFQEGPYDWYLKIDGGLGDVMLKVFYLLNAFDFTDVDRSALRGLYQRYYDPAERKKLGEFYTPPEVIKYLLQAVDWPGEGRLLDFSCGSGGFLVEALKDKLEDMESRGLSAEAQWREAGNIFGFDINPFAAHIAEMNLLFMLVDKFRSAMDERQNLGEEITLPDLNIYNLDALLDGRELKIDDNHVSEWKDEIFRQAVFARDVLKYDYIVGNPPYIRNERLPEPVKDVYSQIFADCKEGNTDIFAYFLKKGMDWLEEGGKMGLIVSQGLADSKSSAKVRRYIENYKIEELVPLEWAEVFKSASVNPFLIIVKKETPEAGHKIKIRQQIRNLKELEEGGGKITEVKQNQWKNLAPDGSWRMEVTEEDLPILEKLNEYPKPFRGEYGMTVRFKKDEENKPEDEKLIRNNTLNMSTPKKMLDGRELRAWSIDWQGRFIEYDNDRISDPKSPEFFKNTNVIIPRLSLTSQAVVFENDYVFRDTVMGIKCEKEIEIYIQCAFINCLINRYYHFFVVRSGLIQKGFSTFYPRVIENFIIPPNIENNQSVLTILEELSRGCHSLAGEMVNGDRELSDWIETEIGGQSKPFSSFSDTDLSSFDGSLEVEKAFFDNGGRLSDGGLFAVGGDRERLAYILQRAALDGLDKLEKRDIEKFPVPAERDMTSKINAKIAEWLERKPTLATQLRKNESEIDEIVLDACADLTKEEKETIKRRVKEFPLSEVIQTPLPGKPTKKIEVKVLTDRFRK